MIEIKGDQEKIITFDFQIEGSNVQPQVRLIIEGVNHNFDLSILAQVKDGQVTAKIPKLEELIEDFSGTRRLRARVDAIIEGNYFETWADEIVVEQSVKVKAKQIDIQTEETKPKITATLSEVKTIKADKVIIEDSVKEAYEEPSTPELKKKTSKKKIKVSVNEKFERLLLKK